MRLKGRKSLFLGEADGGFGTLSRNTHLATELVEYDSTNQGKSQAKRVCTLLCQRYRLVVPPLPLGRIAPVPEHPSGTAVAHDGNVLAIEQGRGTVLLGIVERY